MEIKKIRKQGDTKMITIPKNSDFKVGDYVLVSKINEPNFVSSQEIKR